MEDERDTCFGPGSVAGAVIGTFFTTLLLLAVAALLYRQWRRHKGKHLVLVTDPEIVEDAYAFDNPCFKDATPSVGRTQERPASIATPADSTPVKDSSRWPTPWTSLGLGTGARNDKRRTLDDSCLGPKATRVSIVSLRSHDFTGLGFNVCGNMREGIFVKDLLHRGPASESGRIHPGDRITSVKISFRNMVYEDALTILSYASPYDVELEVESGGTGSKPATLLKKSVGPSPSRICHPLYRSQSIPEFSRGHKSTAKRLFVADANDSLIGSGGSNYSTMNSTLKSSKSTPGTHTVDRIQHDDAITSSTPMATKSNHHKFGIKVLPALDGTVHRIENQNEHNTNLERRNSKKTNAEQQKQQRLSSNSVNFEATNQLVVNDEKKNRQIRMESIQQKDNPSSVTKRRDITNSMDVPDKGEKLSSSSSSSSPSTTVEIPSEVPAEVHNAAMAARRNRKSSAELLNGPKPDKEAIESSESIPEPSGPRSPQRNKRKAPAPPKIGSSESETVNKDTIDKDKQSSPKQQQDDSIDTIADYTESLNDYVSKVRDNMVGDNLEGSSQDDTRRQQRLENQRINRRNSESDTDSELQNSFTTIELNSADITIHCTPVPEVNDGVDEDDDDDIYRKAASLGDLSKYETSKTTPTMLERAQSLDMTDTGSKKRKAPLPPPEDINESTEDLTKLDQIDTFDRRKLKKSSEWGTLEDAIGWRKVVTDENIHNSGVTVAESTRMRKKSNGSGSTLERSKSAIDIKLKEEPPLDAESESPNEQSEETKEEVSIELYNLPLSKRLTEEFIRTERSFNPDEDNSLARIVNDGKIVKNPTIDEVELDFRQAKPLPSDDDEQSVSLSASDDEKTPKSSPSVNEDFNRALKYFETYSDPAVPHIENEALKIDLTQGSNEWKEEGEENKPPMSPTSLYAGKKLVTEDLAMRITIDKGCRGCEERGSHNKSCQKLQQSPEKRGSLEDDLQAIKKKVQESERSVSPIHLRVQTSKSDPVRIFETKSDSPSLTTFQGRKTKAKQTESNDSYLPVSSKSPVEESSFESHYAKRIVNISNSKIEDDEDEDEYEFGSSVTVNSKNLSQSPKDDDRHNISNVSVSSGENSEDSGLVRESIDYNPSYDTENRPPLPSTPMPVTEVPRKMTYITEIKVSANRGRPEQDNENEEKSTRREIMITSNGKHIGGKKPPVPPRRSDITKTTKDDEKQVVYVSEYKPIATEDSTVQDTSSSETKPLDMPSRKFEHWIFVGDNNKEQNPWGNGSSPPQPVTNIMLSSDQKTVHQ